MANDKYLIKLRPKSEEAQLKNYTKDLEKFWVCDIESRKWIEFVTIGVYDGEVFSHFEDMEEFFQFIFDDETDKVFYAHFGGRFDFLFLLEHCFCKKQFRRVEGMIPRGSGLLCFDLIEERNLTGDKEVDAELLKSGQGKRIKITFRDSSALLPFGLKDITNNFKVETLKGEWDHTTTTKATPELLSYCEDDCKGLHQSIQKYMAWPIIRKSGFSPTIAGQAMKVFQTFMNHEIISLRPKLDQFVRRGYFGGRTEIFKPLFLGPEKLSCWDVNSLYPTAMKIAEYPTHFDCFETNYYPERMGFYEAEVEVPENMYVPPLGTVWLIDGKPKFVFPTGRFKGVWTTIELEYARSIGVKIISTGKGALFHSGGKIFERYVDTLYEIREKSERESVDNVLAKLLLNSCYGRFGLVLDREGLAVDDGKIQGAEFTKFGSGEDAIKLLKTSKRIRSFSNVAISAWVTSVSRIYMHKIYMKSPELLYYTDTDSLFSTAQYEDSKALGGLKQEYECAQACFLLPKTYVVEGVKSKKLKVVLPDPGENLKTLSLKYYGSTEMQEQIKAWNPNITDWDNLHPEKFIKIDTDRKVTMKGFDKKKTAHFRVEDFMTCLEGDLKKTRVHQAPKFATFKTALAHDKVLYMCEETERAIQSLYDKRIIYKTEAGFYETRPHLIVDGQPIWYRETERTLSEKILRSLNHDAKELMEYEDDSELPSIAPGSMEEYYIEEMAA